MKNLTIILLFSAFSLLASAQTFDEKTYADINKSFEKNPIGYLKANAAPDYMCNCYNNRWANASGQQWR